VHDPLQRRRDLQRWRVHSPVIRARLNDLFNP